MVYALDDYVLDDYMLDDYMLDDYVLDSWRACEARGSLALFSETKQKYQNGNIHRKLLKVPTSEREGG
jgi:hypothetical protein